MKGQNFTNRKMKDLDPDECYRVVNRIYHQLRGKSIGKIGRGILYRKWKLMVESIGSEWVIKESEGWIRQLKFKRARSLKSAIQFLVSHLEMAYRLDIGQEVTKVKSIPIYHQVHRGNLDHTFNIVSHKIKSPRDNKSHSTQQYYKSKEDYRKAVEKIGMEKAMEHERLCGHDPKDVSEYRLGYDIESNGRRIEVKASNYPIHNAEIWLTPNELRAAEKYGNQYYLYIVVTALTNPTLFIIENPIKLLSRLKTFYRLDPEDYMSSTIVEDIYAYTYNQQHSDNKTNSSMGDFR